MHNNNNCIIFQQLGEYQGGFMKRRSCMEQILRLKFIIRNKRRRSKNIYVTHVDFKKAYYSVDKKTLFNTLTEFGTDDISLAILKQTPKDAKSKIKFLVAKISYPFEIKTDLRQWDGLWSLVFNCELEKVTRKWRKGMEEEGIHKIKIGRKENKLEINCLTFVGDLEILAENIEDAIKQIASIKQTAERAGLELSLEKTKYMTNVKEALKYLEAKYRRINKVSKFKYLWEII